MTTRIIFLMDGPLLWDTGTYTCFIRIAIQLPITSANSEAICAPIQIKHVGSSVSCQQVIYQQCYWLGRESPIRYGSLNTASYLSSSPLAISTILEPPQKTGSSYRFVCGYI